MQITNKTTCLAMSVFLMATLCMATVGKTIYVDYVTSVNMVTAVSDPVPEIDVAPETVDVGEVSTGSSVMLYATILTIVASMAALLLAAVAFWQVLRVSRNVSKERTDAIKPGEKKKLAEAADKIASLEHRVDSFENRINEHVGQSEGCEAKLNENAAELQKANQGINRNSTALQETNSKIDAVKRDVESLQQFKDSVEATSSRILDAFSVMQTGIPEEVDTTTEQQTVEPEETSTDTEEVQNQANQTKQSEQENPTDYWKYHYPD
ncbi:MAG: hypothetical protein ACYTFW_25300 [Planctomycetota bacterium]|jgi:septal ring factor EnvC (AmiA/AmiB activator)